MSERTHAKRPPVRSPAPSPAPGSAPSTPTLQARAEEPDLRDRLSRADRLGHHFGRVQVARKGRTAGLPDPLRAGIESLSGLSMEDVRVHYDSSRPAEVQAHAFAQGSHIHLAPGQEEHLAHEAWHVVQQRQGRVRPNTRMQGVRGNDEAGLEREADAMGRRAAAMGWGAGSADGATPAAAPSSLPAGPAPIQCVRWTWNQASKQWSAVGGSSSTSTPPAHEGRYDGEEFDDTYSQASDPTVKPFLRTGEAFMGESGARKQLGGTPPSSSEIRVPAFQPPTLRGGSGLHEVAPTNLKGEIAKSKNPVMVGIQSGLRTATSRQMFRRTAQPGETATPGSTEVGAHTGFAPNPSRRGSTHTKGQGPAHDKLRETSRSLMSETDSGRAVNEMALSHIASQPTGTEVFQSPYISGMQPSVLSIGPIGPPVPSGTPDPERVKLAQMQHRGRERVKKRARSLKRSLKKGRSPSPPRKPIDDQGGGGSYVTDDPSTYPLSPVPMFEGAPDSFESTANTASWLTAPQREGFPYDLPVATSSTTTSSTTSTITSTPGPSTPSVSTSVSTPTPVPMAIPLPTPIPTPTPVPIPTPPPRKRRRKRKRRY